MPLDALTGTYLTFAVLMTVCIAASKRNVARLIALPYFGFALLMGNLNWIALAFLLSALGFATESWQLRAKVFGLAAVLQFVGMSFLLEHSAGLTEMRRLRERFAPVSIMDRLEPMNERGQMKASFTALPDPVEAALVRFEERAEQTSRDSKLAGLHSKSYEAFVAGRGFGVIRAVRIRKERLELPPLKPIPTTPSSICFRENEVNPPRRADLHQFHESRTLDFLNPDRLGWAPSKTQVVGFEPHAFQEHWERQPALEPWAVARLELISLLKHDTPVAYVSENLPNLEELDDVPTRPLDRFETSALSQLRIDEDSIVEEHPTMIRMLGAIRAGKSCLVCHEEKRGVLLGAFSYELRPVQDEETGTTDRKKAGE